MKHFLITYDLRGSEEEYADLIAALRDAGAVRLQKSVWYLDDDRSTDQQLSDRFGQYMDTARDRLLVVRWVEWAGFNNMGSLPGLR
jgi:CRISPR/Cas system-associated endoribonuclease Cas2